jgi:hypothetical protein
MLGLRRHLWVRAPLRRCLVLAGVLCAGRVSVARAQGSAATIEVRVTSTHAASGAADVPVHVQLQSVTDLTQSQSAEIGTGASVRFRRVPPGRYRLIAGPLERPLDVASGDALTVDITRADPPADPAYDMRVTGTHRTAYGTRFDAAALELLPQSGGVYGLIERSDPLVITERLEGGGAYPEPQRLGASGGSWTQTSFRFGDADLTDPDRTGVAMLYPNLDTLQAVGVITAGLPVDGYGGGASVMLAPRAPSATWQRTIAFAGSPPAFQSVNPLTEAASIARLRSAAGGSFVVSGPLSTRLGLLMAGTLARSSRLERERLEPLDSRALTLSAHLAYKATARDDVRVFAQADRLSFPVSGRATLVDRDLAQQSRATLLSTTWNRTERVGLAWSADATYAHITSEPALSGMPVIGTMERLRDGPVYELASSATSRRHRTSLNWRGDPGPVSWRGSRHRPEFGASASWTGVTRSAPGSSLIGELVDGRPARAWQYASDGAPSQWGGRELAFWATDEIPVTSSIDIDLGLRASSTAASRDGAAAHIPWRALSPKISGTWHVLPDDRVTFRAGYARYAARLPLDYLSYGDPHALAGSVRRWNDLNGDQHLQASEVGPTIAAVGPCCANGRLNTIAADLEAPRTAEFLVAVQARLTDHLVLRLAATDRRTSRLIQPVNAADTAANYSLTHVEDPGLDLLSPGDDQLLPVFNRLPASFGTDSYVLQNVDQNSARDHGLDIVLERPFDGRWGTLIGATAHKSEGMGGSRGFRPDENDQGVLGEVFSDANAATYASGRLFFERGYVIKWSATYRLPYGLRGGTAARYQDGQHFTRVVIAPDVQQGVEFIPALPRGLTRFTYTFTLDTRLEKTLQAGGGRASVVLEVYNLLNTNNEVEEYEVTGPAFRAPTAVQPPRSVRLGVRFTF